MASGTSGRPTNSGSKAFDFASDDILCSYEDENNGIHSDPSISANSAKDFQRSRVARSSVFPSATYSTPEESSFNQDVVTTVDKTMKKYTDNLLRFLEGISSRLSQLELYCYNLDKSIGEMRSDLVGDHEESDSKLKSLDKHIQEVHRSVQILRDKQELADTQKELAKLQLVQKEPSSITNNTQQNEDRSSPHTCESSQKSEDSSDAYGKQLVLHQVAPQPPPPTRPIEHQQPSFPTQNMTQQVHGYYLAPQQMTNMPPPPSQPSQIQYIQPQSQIQDPSRMMAPQPTQQTQVNQTPQVHYQLQWSNQPQPQPQHQMRPSSQMVYSSYMPSSQANQSPAEMAPMQPGSAGPENYGYGVMTSGPRAAALPPGNTYLMFDSEGGRVHPPPSQHNFQQGAYPPNTQRMNNANILIPQTPRNHPYNELIEKLVNMGYRSDHVVGLIQRLEESGQHVDFNTVLDRLNGGGHPTGVPPQRAWSG